MKRQIRVNGAQHSATSHYLKNYGYIPLWVVVKVLSFGIVGELYTVMKREDQEEIANMNWNSSWKQYVQGKIIYADETT